MKFKVLLIILLVGSSAQAQQSALGTLAASMQPGTWAELPTTGMVAAFTGTAGSTGIINPYGMTMVRDTVAKCSHFLGSDHGGNYTPGPLATWRHVKYCEATNAWTILSTPPWVIFDATQYTDAHGYHLTAINSAGRKLYRMPYNSPVVHVMHLDTGVWSLLPQHPTENSQVINTIEFFPERNALLFSSSSGALSEFREATQAWHDITPPDLKAGLVSTWQWINCNPILHECLFGSTTKQHWKYSQTGVFTRLADIPDDYRTYDGSGINGLWVSDTGSKFLLMTDPSNGTGRNVFEFDLPTQTFGPASQVPNKRINNSTNWNVVAIPEHGVTMWIWATGSGTPENRAAGVYLYKHGIQPPDTVLPLVSITTPTNTSSVTGTINLSATASDNVGVAGVQFKDDGVNIGPEDTAAPYSVPWTVAVAGSHSLSAVARDWAGNKTTAAVTVSGTVAPPPTGTVGGYPMPTLLNEKETYANWGWSWTAVQDPVNLTDPKIPPYVVSAPDIHYGTEGDDLWTYLMMYRRTGNPVYLNRANAWARYFKEDYRNCVGNADYCDDRNQYGLDHFYGYGLLALYEHNGDGAALLEAKNLAADLALMYATPAPFGCLPLNGCLHYGTRQIGRHLIFATRIAEVTKDPVHVALRDKVIATLLSPDAEASWSATHGMYFVGEFSTDSTLGNGAYAAGSRINSPMGIAILAEGMFRAYLATKNPTLRAKLIAMARYTAARGLDATYQYSGSTFGVVNGQTWHSYSATSPVTFWDPVYTTSSVNLLVMGYKLTGDRALLDASKKFFNRGTKGVYGSPTQRSAPDNAVGHFIDTTFDSSSGNFYLDKNKGELLYTYLIFENGGEPTVEGSQPVNAAPIVQPMLPVNVSISQGQNTASAVLTGVASDDGLPAGSSLTYRWTGAGVTFGNPTQEATNATAPAGKYTVTFTANDGALSSAQSMAFTVTAAPPANQPPTVTIKTPAPGQIITAKTFTLSVSATDDLGISWLELYVNNQLVKSAATSTMTYSLNTSPYKGKTIAVKAIARDADGLAAQMTVNASVKK